MKTKLKAWMQTYLLVLTEVPGWPDAPVSARIRRSLPIVIPCVGMVVLLVWNLAFHIPRVREQREQLKPLIELESQISTLRLAFSEQQVGEIAERATSATRLLLDSPAELPALLQSLKKEAMDRGWDANFFTSGADDASPSQDAVLNYLPVRAKMTPMRGNTDSFNSFMSWLERISLSGKRIDLIRLAVRADERQWHLVELNFRLAASVSHEKTP